MKTRQEIRESGFGRSEVAACVAVLCFLLPFMVRLPNGVSWAFQYILSDESLLSVSAGSVFLIGIFSCPPAIVTAGAVLLSRPRFYLPGVLASVTAFYWLGMWHHDNDLASDAQAGLSLIFIPLYTAFFALLAGVAGLAIQESVRWCKRRGAAGRQQ